MSRYKPQVATNRPAAQPIHIALGALPRRMIIRAADRIVEAQWPGFPLGAFLFNAGPRALDGLAAQVCDALPLQHFGRTDVIAVLVTPHAHAGL